MDDNVCQLNTQSADEQKERERIKASAGQFICEHLGLRQPPLGRLDRTASRIAKLSVAAERLTLNSLSLDGGDVLLSSSVREVYRVIEETIKQMRDHLDELEKASARSE